MIHAWLLAPSCWISTICTQATGSKYPLRSRLSYWIQRHYLETLDSLHRFTLQNNATLLFSYRETSIFQLEIFRVFIAMTHLRIPMSDWVSTLENNFVLRTICGLKQSEIPPIGSFYDFVSRIVRIDELSKLRVFHRKPKKKLKQGEKLPQRHPDVVFKIILLYYQCSTALYDLV